MAQPTTYTLSGPTAAVLKNQVSGEFTVTIGAGDPLTAPIVITPAAAGSNGTFVPKTVTLSATVTSAKFRWIPSAADAVGVDITTTDSGSLTDPAAVTVTAVTDVPALTSIEPTFYVSWAAKTDAVLYEVHVNGRYMGATELLGMSVELREITNQIRVTAYGPGLTQGSLDRPRLGTGEFSVRMVPSTGGATVTLT